MKLLVINGPNLNMLGIREPSHYGTETFESLCSRITAYACQTNNEILQYQSNHEGDLVDKIQEAYFTGVEGIVINPGAYTHTSIALRDALSSVKIPAVEVHISDVNSREDFRKISYIRDICVKTISGHGTAGYFEAIDFLLEGNKE